MELPGEKLIIRLWETLAEKGIGSVLKPFQIRREGLAHLEIRRAELLTLAQAERDAEDIRSGRKELGNFGLRLEFDSARSASSTVAPDPVEPLSLPHIVQVAGRQAAADSVRRQVNVAGAIAQAEATLQNDSHEPADQKVDDDWLYRWRDLAGEVSNEQLQQLWGQVLAGEVKSPGAFSLRTLEFLRNLSQSEAILISTLAPFVVNDFVWSGDLELLGQNKIEFKELLALQDLGLLSGVGGLGLNKHWKIQPPQTPFIALWSHGKMITARSAEPGKQLNIGACVLTAQGKQVLGLGSFVPHMEYLTRLGKVVQSQGFAVGIGDGVRLPGNLLGVRNEVPLGA